MDDSLTTRMLERGILEAAGYTVDAVADRLTGLDLAAARSYGVIVVGREIGGMPGPALIAAIRDRGGTAPRCLLTQAEEASAQDGPVSGAIPVQIAPPSAERLTALIGAEVARS